MQLSTIKIAGFKSFVDPTTISLPSRRVAIVGPNGCGKSNIIDAVTWVMGESSPKYLRGEALTDVIFNGSNARKAVGQASVELIFDNSDGSVGGEYAKFAEISVRRQINRDSDSTYYLNGVRCRKRDIVDIFLGTGLGPRSYSIVGQNMISRIVEAKPDELRTYLEEAAGISKYKERRHETELRIGHTKDNLARVQDLRNELENQLTHLKHQANVAEKFKAYKQQERVLRAELYAIEWRALDAKLVDYTLQIQREETAYEAKKSEQISTEREIEQTRDEQRVTHDAFQEIQRRYYAVGNEITRIEQEIVYHQERQRQWEHDLKQVEKDAELICEQQEEADDHLLEFEHDLAQLEPALTSAKKEYEALYGEFKVAEESTRNLQTSWDDFQQGIAKTTQTAQVEKTRIQHLEQQLKLLESRKKQLAQDQDRYDFSLIQNEIETLIKEVATAKTTLETENKNITHKRQALDDLRHEQQEATSELDKIRNETQQSRGQQASLEALQQTALGQRNNRTQEWIAKHHLTSKPRLAQNIEVAKGWEFAVEKALGSSLQAICVESMGEIVPHLHDFKSGNMCMISAASEERNANQSNKGTLLLEKIKSKWPLDALLSDIYVADSLDDALSLCETLTANESVMTRDGVWLNPAWVRILREEDPAMGVFQREQELKQLQARIEHLEITQETLESQIATRREQIKQLELQCDQLQQQHGKQQAQVAEIDAQRKMKEERLSELKAQADRFNREQAECYGQLEQIEADLEEARVRYEEAMHELSQQSAKREIVLQARDNARENLEALRDQVNQQKEKMHALEIRLQTAKSQKDSLKQTIARLNHQQSALAERKMMLESEHARIQPIDDIKQSLAATLDKHVSVEAELNKARAAVETLDQAFRQLEEKRQFIERDSNRIRSVLEGYRLECQGWKVKAETLREQIKETEFKLEDILKELPQAISVEEWQAKLNQLINRINRLGPINLVAIDEYATCLERKQYLDQQIEDLQAGLETLENAIAKIDKETKMRFKETFDKVNTRFQELFPTIFGGGKAYLELNSDDLLTAGITMMACPPGKRNSSIYLLSGGEKSLTAIALIFSIFHLNPAPFCLLDEVDAALDDANVHRFTRLVKVMAEKTQFLFISHNKITIEMGEHLIGVTMNEPGVSRLVSVDIEKAMSLAEA